MGGNHFSGLALRMITLPRTKIYQSIKAVKREGGGGEQDGREELEGRASDAQAACAPDAGVPVRMLLSCR